MTSYDINDFEQDVAELTDLLEHPHRLSQVECRHVAEVLHRIEAYRPEFGAPASGDPNAPHMAELERRIDRFRGLRKAEREAREISPGHEGMTPMLGLHLAPQTGT
jgi:hypothetical protein